ncbi:OsmC family protein [Amycolatopsis magusensis]|uniref:OsmC family protein n=1 Tax=Amycolatopsis magusensis TaxID=882444 RepID=UPI003792AB93
MTERIYTTEATSGRGSVRIDGRDDMGYRVGEPSGEQDRLNPERLYAAALATCLHQSLVLVASSADVETAESAVTARVSLTHDGERRYGLNATVSMTLPGVPDEKLRDQITAEAVRVCPMVGEVPVSVDDKTPGVP